MGRQRLAVRRRVRGAVGTKTRLGAIPFAVGASHSPLITCVYQGPSIREAVTKMARKESTLPPGEAGRVLDRLLLLEQVIGPEDVLQVLEQPGYHDARRCTLTFEVTCWVVLALGVLTELPIRQVFKAARRLRPGEATPHRASLCLARQRLGVAPVRALFGHTVRLLATPDTPGAFYQGLRLMALDGSVFDVPDSEANARAFGYPQGGRGPGAFPQVRKLSLVAVGTHAEAALPSRASASRAAASSAWPPPCSATCAAACCWCGTAASSATGCGSRLRRPGRSCWPGSAPG